MSTAQSNPAIENDIPGLAVIGFAQLDPDTDVVAKMQLASRAVRAITQDYDYSTNNAFGQKALPTHFSFDEIIDGHTKNGQEITLEEAHAIAWHFHEELTSIGMNCKFTPHPDLAPPNKTVEKLKKFINDGTNVLLYGAAGAGKTSMTEQACLLLGYRDEFGKLDTKRVKYLSLPTLSPEDFVGIPAPDPTDPTSFKYLMMKSLFEAEVLILDEFNRCHPKVLNGIMQIMHGRAINDRPLVNLKSIVAMINPPEDGDYQGTDEVDWAVLDRFDHYIEIKADPSVEYLTRVLTPDANGDAASAHEVADALVSWYKHELGSAKNKELISPRRLEKMGRAYLKGQGLETTLYRKKTGIATTLLADKLKGRKILTGEDMANDPEGVIKRILVGTEENSMELAMRARHIIDQFYATGDFKRMGKSLPVLEVLARDQLTSIKRNESLNRFVTNAAKRNKMDGWLAELYKAADTGIEALNERRKQVSDRLAAAVAAGGDGKVSI